MIAAQGGPKKTKTTAAFSTSPLEDEEHILSILASLFTSLDSETPARIRTLQKFVENDYEKIDRLLEFREAAVGRLSRIEREVDMERRVSERGDWVARRPQADRGSTLQRILRFQIMQENGEEITEEETDDWYLRKINAGLSHLQNIDYVLAWVVMEDDGVSQCCGVHRRT
jgi:beta-catenin-like protein 1